MATIENQMPPHFFPTAAPGLKAFLWNCLAQRQITIHEALADYFANYVHSATEREIAEIIVENLICDWHVYLATNHIVKAHR